MATTWRRRGNSLWSAGALAAVLSLLSACGVDDDDPAGPTDDTRGSFEEEVADEPHPDERTDAEEDIDAVQDEDAPQEEDVAQSDPEDPEDISEDEVVDVDADEEGSRDDDVDADVDADADDDADGDVEEDTASDAHDDVDQDAASDVEEDTNGDTVSDVEEDTNGDTVGDVEDDTVGDVEDDTVGDVEDDTVGDVEDDTVGDVEVDTIGDVDIDVDEDAFGDVDDDADAISDAELDASDAGENGECEGEACPPTLFPYATLARATLRAEENNGNYSFYFISSGDLTGNGSSDLVITDLRWAGPDGLGAIRVFEGPLEGTVEEDATYLRLDAQQATRASLGATMVGDFNGNGQADLAIVESMVASGRTTHHVHIYFGPLDPGVRSVRSADVVVEATTSHRFTGTRPCVAGDLNGDGRDDLVMVGTALRGEEERTRAAGFVFFGASLEAARDNGGTILASDADRVVLSGVGVADACTTSGDLDGTGVSGFWMHGARETTPDGLLSDVVYWVGSDRDDNLLLHEDAPYVGSVDTIGSGFGWALEGGRDVTGNGRPDLIVGHPYARNADGMQTGMAVLVEVDALHSGELTPRAWFQGALNSEMGVWVGAARIQGEDVARIVAGEPWFATDDTFNEGGSGLFFLSASGGESGAVETFRASTRILWESDNEPSDGRNTSVGYSGVVGDLTGDGCDDIAFGEFSGGNNEARVFVVSGCDLGAPP